MPRLLPLLLTAATLTAIGTPAVAKDIPGTPKILIGEFAEKPKIDCGRLSILNERMQIVFGEHYYNTCDGKIYCVRDVISHKVTNNGFVLRVKDSFANGQSTTYTQRFVVIDKDTIKYVSRKPIILHRCPEIPQPPFERVPLQTQIPDVLMQDRNR